MATTKEIGDRAERIAGSYLRSKAHQIISTNWRYRRAEIDIISRYQSSLIFIEVKSRTSDLFGVPELAVNEKKIALISDAAKAYIRQEKYEGEIRFDIISIVFNGTSNYALKHFEDAFFPGLERG